jgi:hypothetical protein
MFKLLHTLTDPTGAVLIWSLAAGVALGCSLTLQVIEHGKPTRARSQQALAFAAFGMLTFVLAVLSVR